MTEDTSDSDISSRIQFGQTERVTEILNCDPTLTPRSSDLYKTIEFGNGGFDIHFDVAGKVTSTFDFTPEGWSAPNKANSAKYASMLGASLFAVYNFANNSELLAEYKIEGSRITQLKAITNQHLIDSLVELFDRFGHGNYIEIKDRGEGKEDQISIDWQGFRDLKPNDGLISYLSRISNRAKNLEVTYDKVIG